MTQKEKLKIIDEILEEIYNSIKQCQEMMPKGEQYISYRKRLFDSQLTINAVRIELVRENQS